jgi:hypothetical protein
LFLSRLCEPGDAQLFGNLLILGVLLALNIVLYVPLVLPYVQRRRRMVHAANLVDAFNGLEKALKHAVPDLPPGFTWEEAIARLKSSGVQTKGMEAALKGYEDYRYGGSPIPNLDFREVVNVANTLAKMDVRKKGGLISSVRGVRKGPAKSTMKSADINAGNGGGASLGR